MWSISKSPAAARTRVCSSRGPVPYWTGMSHPPKSIIRAPARTCQSCSFVSMQPPDKKGERMACSGNGMSSRSVLLCHEPERLLPARWMRPRGDCPFGGCTRHRGGTCGNFPECRPSAILLPESFCGPCVGPLFAPSAIPTRTVPGAIRAPYPVQLRARRALRGFSLALIFRQNCAIVARALRRVKPARCRSRSATRRVDGVVRRKIDF